MNALVKVCVGNSVYSSLSARRVRVQGCASFLRVMALSREKCLVQRYASQPRRRRDDSQ